jgi:hypothetical protein
MSQTIQVLRREDEPGFSIPESMCGNIDLGRSTEAVSIAVVSPTTAWAEETQFDGFVRVLYLFGVTGKYSFVPRFGHVNDLAKEVEDVMDQSAPFYNTVRAIRDVEKGDCKQSPLLRVLLKAVVQMGAPPTMTSSFLSKMADVLTKQYHTVLASLRKKEITPLAFVKTVNQWMSLDVMSRLMIIHLTSCAAECDNAKFVDSAAIAKVKDDSRYWLSQHITPWIECAECAGLLLFRLDQAPEHPFLTAVENRLGWDAPSNVLEWPHPSSEDIMVTVFHNDHANQYSHNMVREASAYMRSFVQGGSEAFYHPDYIERFHQHPHVNMIRERAVGLKVSYRLDGRKHFTDGYEPPKKDRFVIPSKPWHASPFRSQYLVSVLQISILHSMLSTLRRMILHMLHRNTTTRMRDGYPLGPVSVLVSLLTNLRRNDPFAVDTFLWIYGQLVLKRVDAGTLKMFCGVGKTGNLGPLSEVELWTMIHNVDINIVIASSPLVRCAHRLLDEGCLITGCYTDQGPTCTSWQVMPVKENGTIVMQTQYDEPVPQHWQRLLSGTQLPEYAKSCYKRLAGLTP